MLAVDSLAAASGSGAGNMLAVGIESRKSLLQFWIGRLRPPPARDALRIQTYVSMFP